MQVILIFLAFIYILQYNIFYMEFLGGLTDEANTEIRIFHRGCLDPRPDVYRHFRHIHQLRRQT